VSTLFGIVALPWIVKPVFGFISDGVPPFGYQASILGVIGGTGSNLVGESGNSSHAYGCNGRYCSWPLRCHSDVIVDSLVVERARAESQAEAGSLQSLCWGASSVEA